MILQVLGRICTVRKQRCRWCSHCHDLSLLWSRRICLAWPNCCLLRRDPPIQYSGQRSGAKLCFDCIGISFQSVCQSNRAPTSDVEVFTLFISPFWSWNVWRYGSFLSKLKAPLSKRLPLCSTGKMRTSRTRCDLAVLTKQAWNTQRRHDQDRWDSVPF